ncbi:MAG: hypothetical protein QME81_05060 [bacterium]|nr:hypothetical protein [bacterium]
MIALFILGTYIAFLAGLIVIEYFVYQNFEKRNAKKRRELEEKVKQLVREKVAVSKVAAKQEGSTHGYFPQDRTNLSRLQLCLGMVKEKPELIANLLKSWMEEKE